MIEPKLVLFDIAGLLIEHECYLCGQNWRAIKMEDGKKKVALYCPSRHIQVFLIKSIKGITEEIMQCLADDDLKTDQSLEVETVKPTLTTRFQTLKRPS